jgi:hypothetical protein
MWHLLYGAPAAEVGAGAASVVGCESALCRLSDEEAAAEVGAGAASVVGCESALCRLSDEERCIECLNRIRVLRARIAGPGFQRHLAS